MNLQILNIFWFKFLLKTRFLMTAKSVLVLMRPQGLRPGARTSTCPILATPLRSGTGRLDLPKEEKKN